MNPKIDFHAIRTYFDQKVEQFGPTPGGVDWNSAPAQEARFKQLVKLLDPERAFSVNDYGSGYGALVEYLIRNGYNFTYTGFDISEPMVAKGKELYQDNPACTFTTQETDLAEADYSFACGIFNKRFDMSDEDWLAYVLQTLHKLDALSRRGFAFNMLTRYSDPERMQPDLYYADPCYLFDYCKTHFARNVALLHDYEVYDFTILVRKQV